MYYILLVWYIYSMVLIDFVMFLVDLVLNSNFNQVFLLLKIQACALNCLRHYHIIHSGFREYGCVCVSIFLK